MSVKVAVRVRPFNRRQENLGSQCCIRMKDNVTYAEQRQFSYDYSFWSHDGFFTDENGIFVGTDDHYSDQRKVYNAIGSQIVQNTWEGYNCCLFAYGQTGSGKSYSMIGYGPNKGLIPLICDQIFQRIQEHLKIQCEVTVSMMQIYNENVRDLLCKQKINLQIRQNKRVGVYVEGLKKVKVCSYKEIQKQIDIGAQSRSIASTLMNECSSRSHTIVVINFVRNDGGIIKFSTINLVDLAGSESVQKTGNQAGDRLRQAGKINQSLSTLGRVIQIVAENSENKKKEHVPYRDSKLTYILRNALGGNSRTAMICAISPSSDNLGQTISTLRYASRTKHIQNKAIINESDTDKLIRSLRQQNAQLKKQLKNALNNYGSSTSTIMSINDQQPLLLDQQKQTQEQKQTVQELVLLTRYITNVSEDQLLSYRIKYQCQNLLIGNKFGQPRPQMVLGALGVLPHHARIYSESKVTYIQLCVQQAAPYTFVNGSQIVDRVPIKHNDRLIFGTSCVFIFKLAELVKEQGQKIKEIDYQFVINEMQTVAFELSRLELSRTEDDEKQSSLIRGYALEDIHLNNKLQQELKKQIVDARHFQFEKKRISQQLQKQQLNSQKVKELEQQLNSIMLLKKRSQKQRQQLQYQTTICNNQNIIMRCRQIWGRRKGVILKNNKKILHSHLNQLIVKLEQFRLMASSIKKNIECKAYIPYSYNEQGTIIKVVIADKEEGRCIIWDKSTFENRFNLVKANFGDYLQQGISSKEEDPFWDPPAYYSYANAYLYLEPIFYHVSFQGKINFVTQGQSIGSINVSCFRSNLQGQPILLSSQTMHIPDPFQQRHSQICFTILLTDINFISNQPKSFKIEYYLPQLFTTQIIYQNHFQIFSYKKTHIFKDINQNLLIHYLQRPLEIQLHIMPILDHFLSSTVAPFQLSQKDSIQEPTQFIQVKKPLKEFSMSLSKVQTIYQNNDVMSKINVDNNQSNFQKNNKKSFRSDQKSKKRSFIQFVSDIFNKSQEKKK